MTKVFSWAKQWFLMIFPSSMSIKSWPRRWILLSKDNVSATNQCVLAKEVHAPESWARMFFVLTINVPDQGGSFSWARIFMCSSSMFWPRRYILLSKHHSIQIRKTHGCACAFQGLSAIVDAECVVRQNTLRSPPFLADFFWLILFGGKVSGASCFGSSFVNSSGLWNDFCLPQSCSSARYVAKQLCHGGLQLQGRGCVWSIWEATAVRVDSWEAAAADSSQDVCWVPQRQVPLSDEQWVLAVKHFCLCSNR